MENFFDLLDIETQNAIWACANEAENEINDAQISEFLQMSCEDSHLMDFMFDTPVVLLDAQMIGCNDDALYTVTSEVKKENKKNKCMEKTIQLKASNRKLNSFEEAVEFCHNYIESIHSNYIEPLDDDISIRTVIQHEEI